MSRLQQKIAAWQQQKLISPEQAQAIMAYEAAAAKPSWVMYGFAILGAFAIGTGLISLIAANWEAIPAAVKLATAGALLLITARLVWQANARRHWLWYDVALLAFMLLCLGSLGLISQIFHVEGSLHGALLSWCAITSGLFLLTRHFFNAWLWLAALTVGLFSLLLSAQKDEITIVMMGLALPLTFALGWLLLRPWRPSAPQVRALGVWAITISLGYLSTTKFVLTENPRESGGLIGILSIGLLSIAICWQLWRDALLRPVQKKLLAAILGLTILPFALQQLGLASYTLIDVAIMAMLGLLAVVMVSMQQKRWFHVFVVLLGLKFLEFYVQAFGGLLFTGLGLLSAGVLLITAVWLWHKFRKPLEAWTEDVVK